MRLPLDTYCNPLPLPEIPRGFLCDGVMPDFREQADPEVLYDGGAWYMYPSGGQAYVSRDLVHWDYHPIEIDHPLGYAPSACRCGERILLTSSRHWKTGRASIWAAPAPLGPFVDLGTPVDRDGRPLELYLDPALFCDDDGRLYLYWGYSNGEEGTICGAEMDPANPTHAIGDIRTLLRFDGANEWEHYGEHHEHTGYGWDEGVSMFKHSGEYYLQYAADGTVFRNYCCAVSRSSASPLGPFTAPRLMLRSPHGFVNGTGHGGMTAGPNGSVWQFYTCRIARMHQFERRIGMDRVVFDAEGNPTVPVTSAPQSVSGGDLGLVAVTENKPATATSAQPFAGAMMAVDGCTHTCWAPMADDPAPALTVDCKGVFGMCALRLVWAELDLDYGAGRTPEPVRYEVRFYDAAHAEVPGARLDCRGNTRDLNVDFRAFAPVQARYASIFIERKDARVRHGLTDFTLFAPPG